LSHWLYVICVFSIFVHLRRRSRILLIDFTCLISGKLHPKWQWGTLVYIPIKIFCDYYLCNLCGGAQPRKILKYCLFVTHRNSLSEHFSMTFFRHRNKLVTLYETHASFNLRSRSNFMYEKCFACFSRGRKDHTKILCLRK